MGQFDIYDILKDNPYTWFDAKQICEILDKALPSVNVGMLKVAKWFPDVEEKFVLVSVGNYSRKLRYVGGCNVKDSNS